MQMQTSPGVTFQRDVGRNRNSVALGVVIVGDWSRVDVCKPDHDFVYVRAARAPRCEQVVGYIS